MRLIVYGAKISYFTGKFEAYLRYREIPYMRIGFRRTTGARSHQRPRPR